jgi:hypothetical protein
MSSEADHLRDVTRREVLTQMGTGLIAVTISTVWGPLSPAEARAQGVSLRALTAAEARTLEALGDVLLPGAREARLAHYVDEQLSRDNPLFALKYMDYQGAYVEFYRQGLQALEQQSFARYRQRFDRCSML